MEAAKKFVSEKYGYTPQNYKDGLTWDHVYNLMDQFKKDNQPECECKNRIPAELNPQVCSNCYGFISTKPDKLKDCKTCIHKELDYYYKAPCKPCIEADKEKKEKKESAAQIKRRRHRARKGMPNPYDLSKLK